VRTLSDGLLAAGPHEWDWRGTDDAGSRVPVGIYHVRAVVDGVASTCSVVWIH
jgi:flagellar hook assembly protein FlgD